LAVDPVESADDVRDDVGHVGRRAEARERRLRRDPVDRLLVLSAEEQLCRRRAGSVGVLR
jgi:hypothetical protein